MPNRASDETMPLDYCPKCLTLPTLSMSVKRFGLNIIKGKAQFACNLCGIIGEEVTCNDVTVAELRNEAANKFAEACRKKGY